MQLLFASRPIPDFSNGTLVTTGNFDGVHLGHQALLRQLKARAVQEQKPLVVLLFEPQPAEYFRGAQAPARLTSLREKVQQLADCQVDYVYCLRFNQKLANMSASDFAERFFFTLLRAQYLLVGRDFCFGHNRQGNPDLLTLLAKERSCQVYVAQDFCLHGVRVSSTRIRDALTGGDLTLAASLLGRPFSLCGRVVRGAGKGREWGTPTANIAMRRLTLPLSGVFCVQACLDDGQILNGVANLGRRPTVDGSKNVLEVHLFDWNQSLYGERLQVRFLHKLRDEIRFPSLEALIARIHDDVKAARAWFAATI